jgi:hypothetical protein
MVEAPCGWFVAYHCGVNGRYGFTAKATPIEASSQI